MENCTLATPFFSATAAIVISAVAYDISDTHYVVNHCCYKSAEIVLLYFNIMKSEISFHNNTNLSSET